MNPEVRKESKKILSRMKQEGSSSPEYGNLYSYLDFLSGLPWIKEEPKAIDLLEAEQILEEDHFGLKKVKKRILEQIAVMDLNRQRENQTICIEDLKVKNMMRNHKLAQHIGSASWSKFFDMLSYKSIWYGNDIVKVPTMYPSSQTCSCCGFKNPLVKNLAIRKWECPECHTKHDRDTNASINILNKGLRMQLA